MKHSTLLSACLHAGFCLVLLLSAHASHGQTVKTIDLIDGSIKEKYEETIPTREVEIVEDGVIVSYSFHHMTMQPDNLYKGAYFLKMKGFGQMDIPGLPSIPTHMDSFTVPEGYMGTVSVLDSSFVEIPMQLAPARKPLLIGDTIGYNYENVPAIRKYAGNYPNQLILGKENHSFRDRSIFNVSFSPLKYDYQNKKVFGCAFLKYKVSFVSHPTIKKRTHSRKGSSDDDIFLNNVTLNGTVQNSLRGRNNIKTTPIGQEQWKDYLIISVPDYEDAVEPFAIWKRKMGYHVQTEYRTNWDPASIIDFVHDTYDTSENLSYLLIVGGNKKIPAKQIGIGEYGYYTDFYYGCINDSIYQEVCVGRIPVDTLEEAFTVLGKIISYELDPIDDASFYQTVLACAQFQDEKNHLNSSITIPDGYEDERFTQTTEEMVTYLVDNLHYYVNRVYNAKDSVVPAYWNYDDNGNVEIPDYLKTSSNFNWHGNRDDIKGYLETGAFLTFYNGHGAFAYWDQPSYSGYDVTYYLNNQKKLPVVFSMSCLTGKFIHEGGQSFSESFLWKNNGGCVGIISASETTYQGHTDILGQGMIDAIWPVPGLRPNFRGINPNYSSHAAVYQLGDILRQGNKVLEESGYCTLYNDSTLGPGLRKRVREVFHCLGDPSMHIYTAKPTPFSYVTIEGSTTSCSVDLSNDSGAITFYNQQTDSVACFLGSHADYTGPTDSLVVCISGHNRIPYIATPQTFQTFYIQNETIGGTKTFSSDTIKVGSNVTTAKPSGSVVFNGTKTTIISRDVEITGETTIELGTEFEISPE